MQGNHIDYVVPMVFPEDPWWGIHLAARGMRFDHILGVRYRSFGTEQMLIRLVKKNMPFVRNIIILLARETQKQRWMDDEGVRIVYHREFIPEQYLPTFNSRAMEMFLHRIPGLSEQFLYGNDDMYPVSPLDETDFFRDGLPCITMKEKDFPEFPNNFQRACMCGLNFVGREFGRSFSKKWYKNGHSIAPILLSTCRHMWEIGGEDIERSITEFRKPHNFNQYIYSWWQWMSGNYVEHSPRRSYFKVTNYKEALEAIRSEDPGIVCINDNEAVLDIKEIAREIRNALNTNL